MKFYRWRLQQISEDLESGYKTAYFSGLSNSVGELVITGRILDEMFPKVGEIYSFSVVVEKGPEEGPLNIERKT